MSPILTPPIMIAFYRIDWHFSSDGVGVGSRLLTPVSYSVLHVTNAPLTRRHDIDFRSRATAWPVCGILDVLYVEHGSDFTSQQLDQIAASLAGRPNPPLHDVIR